MEDLLVVLVWLVAWFIGSIAGGWWLISIPFLIFLWYNAPTAISINILGAVLFNIWAFTRYQKSDKVRRHIALPIMILAIVWWWIGTNYMLDMDETILQYFIWVMMVVLLPLILFKKTWLEVIQKSSFQKGLWYLAFFILTIISTIYPWGSGLIALYILSYFFWLTFIQANATRIPPQLIKGNSDLAPIMQTIFRNKEKIRLYMLN